MARKMFCEQNDQIKMTQDEMIVSKMTIDEMTCCQIYEMSNWLRDYLAKFIGDLHV